MTRPGNIELTRSISTLRPVAGAVRVFKWPFKRRPSTNASSCTINFSFWLLSSFVHQHKTKRLIVRFQLSLSVACPIWRGFLSEIDSRWNVLSQTTDDRTEQEIRENTFHSSRYGSSPIFLSESSSTYNDRILNFDQSVFDKLVDRGSFVLLHNKKDVSIERIN